MVALEREGPYLVSAQNYTRSVGRCARHGAEKMLSTSAIETAFKMSSRRPRTVAVFIRRNRGNSGCARGFGRHLPPGDHRSRSFVASSWTGSEAASTAIQDSPSLRQNLSAAHCTQKAQQQSPTWPTNEAVRRLGWRTALDPQQNYPSNQIASMHRDWRVHLQLK